MRQLLAIGVLAACLAGGALAQDKDAPKDRVLAGDAKCTRCHDENDTFPVLAIGKTRHGTRAERLTAVFLASSASIHFSSEDHVQRASRPLPACPPR